MGREMASGWEESTTSFILASVPRAHSSSLSTKQMFLKPCCRTHDMASLRTRVSTVMRLSPGNRKSETQKTFTCVVAPLVCRYCEAAVTSLISSAEVGLPDQYSSGMQ